MFMDVSEWQYSSAVQPLACAIPSTCQAALLHNCGELTNKPGTVGGRGAVHNAVRILKTILWSPAFDYSSSVSYVAQTIPNYSGVRRSWAEKISADAETCSAALILCNGMR
jgi:hypothetical protein